MSFQSTSTLQQPDDVSAAAAASSGSLGGGGGGAAGIEVIQLDASGGNVTETLPAPSEGATALALRVDNSTGNTATLETAGSSQEIRFPEGKDKSSTTLDVEQSLLLSSDGSHWYVEEGQGLSAKAEAVTTDAATKDSPSLTQTASYDSDTSGGVTSSDVSIERYVRTDTDGNATLVYEAGGTEIARLTDEGRFETRKDQEAFADGSLTSGQDTNSLLQVEDAGTVLTTDAASLNFTGSGLSLSQNGDEITIDVSGGSGSDIDIEQNQSTIVGGATGLSFEGSGIDSVDNDGDGTATVNISKGSSTEVQEGGTAQVSDVTVLDFVGGDFSVSTPSGGEAEVSLQDDTVTVAGNPVSLGGSTGIAHGELSNISPNDHHEPFEPSDYTPGNDVSKSDVGLENVPNTNIAYSSTIPADNFTSTEVSNLRSGQLEDGSTPWTSNNFFDAADARSAVEGTSDVADLAAGLGTDGQVIKKVSGAANWVSLSASDITGVSPDSDDDAHHPRPSAGDGLSESSNTFSVNENQVDHDSLNQYVVNEHVDHSAISVSAGTALSGGGDLTASRTLNVSGPLTGIPFKTSGDNLEWQADANNDLILQNTADAQTLLKVDQDTGTVFAAGDVVAFGLSGGGGTGSTSGLQASDPLTLDTTTNPDTIGLSVGSGLTVNSGTLEADGSVGVSSVFGRPGDVTAQAGDYSASQISNFDAEAVNALQAHNGTNVDADTLDGVEGSNYAQTDVFENFQKGIDIERSTFISDVFQDRSEFLQLKNGGGDQSAHISFNLGSGELGFLQSTRPSSNKVRVKVKTRVTGKGIQTAAVFTEAGRTGLGGETTPSYALDVNGTLNFSGDIRKSGSLLDAADLSGASGTSGQVLQSDGVNASFETLSASNINNFDENAQDAVDSLLSGGAGIDLSYDDSNNELTITSTVSNTDTQTDLENSAGVVVSDADGISFEAGANTSVAVSSDNDRTGTVLISSTDTDTQLTDSEVKTAIENATSDVAINISGDADTLDGVEGSNYARTDVNERFFGEVIIDEETVVNSVSGLTASGNSQNTDWNQDYQHKIEGANNALTITVPSETNEREAAVQVGHDTGSFSNALGKLFLNPLGGEVVVEDNAGFGGQVFPSYAIETAGDMRATGEVEAFLGSDRRLKTDLGPLDSALDKVNELTGYGFDWEDRKSVQPHKRGQEDVGLIAQEVEDVLPEAVKTFSDGHSEGYKSVSYDKLVPLLVEAIKDLRSQVNKLK